MISVAETRWELPEDVQVRSLAWVGDDLVDWISGGLRFSPDGSFRPPDRAPILDGGTDRALTSPSGRYAVVYAERGTTGFILREGEVIREISRDPLHADQSDYPVALGRLPDGREVLAHCPDGHWQFEIEDVVTGARLTDSVLGKWHAFIDMGSDYYTRLELAADGQHLLAAGWIWHPVGIAEVCEIGGTPMTSPRPMQGTVGRARVSTEVTWAAFDGSDHLVIATPLDDEIWDEDATDAVGLAEIARWSIREDRWVVRIPITEEAGILMPLGSHVVAFYDHPRLVDLSTGEVVGHWRHLRTGRQRAGWSVVPCQGADRTPPLALDPANRRFAVATDGGVTALRFQL